MKISVRLCEGFTYELKQKIFRDYPTISHLQTNCTLHEAVAAAAIFQQTKMCTVQMTAEQRSSTDLSSSYFPLACKSGLNSNCAL